MKIGEISSKTGLSPHTLRYYEKLGFISAAKSENGHRNYNAEDLELLNWISCLKHSGMSLNRIKSYVNASRSNDFAAMTGILSEHLNRLCKQQEDIAHYKDVTGKKLSRLKKHLT